MTELENLYEVVSSVGGTGKLLTLQPGGNHGDSLIRIGANKFFDDNGIDTIPFRQGEIRDDKPPSFGLHRPEGYYKMVKDYLTYAKHSFSSDIAAVYIHGGANFNDFWSSGARCYKIVTRLFDVPVIIGPQSGLFEKTDITELFGDVDNPTHFFCRDEYSHELMAEALADVNINLYLDDDTALYLDTDDLPVQEMKTDYSLIALRRDKESADVLIDETVEPPIRVGDISIDEPTYESFVNVGARAQHIYTDRLHGAILATLLDKPVTFYENAYHKNRGVYEYSLTEHENIKFIYDS